MEFVFTELIKLSVAVNKIARYGHSYNRRCYIVPLRGINFRHKNG